jgi:acetolactate synthase I/II/III large subunit
MPRPSHPSDAAPSPARGGDCSDLLVQYLDQIGVGYVFGVPGGAIEPLVNALARGMRRGGPKLVIARHEAGAAFMADGYARETGRLGVCFATTGPGATNLITGVASAHQNKVPLLAVTAQTPLETFGRGAMQESGGANLDTVGMFEHCTRLSTLISHPGQFEHKLVSAILAAFREPCRATHLSVPLDVLRAPTPASRPALNLARMLEGAELHDRAALIRLAQEIEAAAHPVFVVGEGARDAVGWILSLAVRLDAPVVTTPHGKGLVSGYHPQFRGVFGFSGHASAAAVLRAPETDCIVAVGTSFGEWASAGWDEAALLNARLIHVDSDHENIAAAPQARLHVRGAPRRIFEELHDLLAARDAASSTALRSASGRPWLKLVYSNDATTAQPRADLEPQCLLDEPSKYRDDSAPIKPQRLMRDLPQLLPPGTRYLADGNSASFWAIHYLHVPDRRRTERRRAGERRALRTTDGATERRSAGTRRAGERRRAWSGVFRSSMEFTCMGFAIGASVGTAFGNPEAPVVCLTGDGSILMNGQEITVAAQHGLTVLFVVMNDSALGTIKHGQRLSGAEQVGYELPMIDFAEFARVLGVPGHVVHSPADLAALDFAEICQRRGPTLIDVRIDPEEVPPLTNRMRGLGALA